MTTWGVVSNAASVTQLAGVDALGLIDKIREAVGKAKRNESDCERLALHVDKLRGLLPHLQSRQEQEAMRVLAGLRGTLSEAHDLVVSCQGSGWLKKIFTDSSIADRFRDVEKKLNFDLSISAIAYVCIVNRLDAQQQELGRGEDLLQFTLAQIKETTNNFAFRSVLSDDAVSGTKVYKGNLHNGLEVAVKLFNHVKVDAFFKELQILLPLRHEHIVRLLGTCNDGGERILVTEYMPNGSLYDHLHGSRGKESPPSPATASWKTRVRVLLGAARAVEHLHRHATPLVIHGNVTSSTVLLDAEWAPRLSGFGASQWQAVAVAWQAEVAGAASASCGGYADPEYCSTGHIRPASDVYGLGVVMLEALTGRSPVVKTLDVPRQSWVAKTLASFAMEKIQAGRLCDVLDWRPRPLPDPWQQIQTLNLVADTAARCVSLHGHNRPAISDVVANLDHALSLL